jgi:hypothetical protein
VTHSSRAWAEQPILAAIDETVDHREACSPSLPKTIPTVRARTSGENLLVVLLVMAPSYLEVGTSGKAGAVQHQSHVMTKPRQFAAPMMRCAAGLNADEASRQTLENGIHTNIFNVGGKKSWLTRGGGNLPRRSALKRHATDARFANVWLRARRHLVLCRICLSCDKCAQAPFLATKWPFAQRRNALKQSLTNLSLRLGTDGAAAIKSI